MSEGQVQQVARLDDRQISAVIALTAAAEAAEAVAPLSEAVLLSIRGDEGSTPISPGTRVAPTPAPHFLLYDGPHLAGYAHLERGPAVPDETSRADGTDPPVAEAPVATAPLATAELATAPLATAELVVDPAHRRHGVGTTLIHALEAAAQPAGVQLWSHGNLGGARAFAVRDGYANIRELWSMRRALTADPLPDVSLPQGFTARPFVVGQDEQAWLRVNASAFVDHPEQGRMTRHDLDQRIAQPWFDPAGFILIEDARASPPVLAASHWTKVVPSDDPQVSPTHGEVYVVGVDPAYQGRGLGKAVTVLGLAHLRARGVIEATLYVDADNTAAVATYEQLGFNRFAVDVMYSPTVHQPVPR